MLRIFLLLNVIFGALPLELSASFLEPNCGVIPEEAHRNENSQAHILQSPWMAYLYTSKQFLCGGSLINHRFVLTAYHCISRDEELFVRLGEYNLSTTRDCVGSNCLPATEEFGIKMAFRNSGYSRNDRQHDIGLLLLKRHVEYKAHIQPICLITNPTVQSQIDGIVNFVATGWGSLTGSPTQVLKSIPITRLDCSECQQRYLVDCWRDQICVSHEAGNPCGGDSGGPVGASVQIRNKLVFIQVGIVSYGNPECLSPSVFTDVTRHIDWIQMVVKMYS